METTKCYICQAKIPKIEGPTSSQEYLPQSPGCWKLYTDILAREYGEWNYPPVHRLAVDAYAAQHPTTVPNNKSGQSVTMHLLNIYLQNELGWSNTKILQKMAEVLKKEKGQFIWLKPPESLGKTTVTDVHTAKTLEQHIELVTNWSISVWEAWEKHHQKVLSYLD